MAERFALPVIATVALAVSGWTVPAFAQRDSAGTADRITVIGCVQRSQPSRGEAVGTTAIPEGETRYVLSNITMASDKDQPPGTTPTRGDLLKAAVNLYRLDDRADALLAPHVGERVEVTGTIAKPRSSTDTTGTITPDSPVQPGPMLLVESLRTVSAGSSSCSP